MAARQDVIGNTSSPSLRSTADGDFITVVLPCLNEEASVGLVVNEALQALENAGLKGEVLVVDNGSDDRSIDVAHAAGARVIHEHRRGYGRAVRSGIAAAKGSIVVMADADWTYDMTKLPSLIKPVRDGVADLAMGARLHQANRNTMPVLHRYVGTPALTAFIRTTGGYGGLTDSQSGYRCFRKDRISALRLKADGMELTSEMLLKSSLHGLRVVEVPTGYRKRVGDSKLNTFSDGVRNLRVLMSLAPEAFFLAPGALMFLLGAFLSVAAFLPTHGIEIGSLTWQPIFFASIALFLGLQTFLVGLVFLWHRARVSGRPMSYKLGFVRSASFPRACTVAGIASLSSGLVIDGLLFAMWIDGRSSISLLPIASVAQSLLLVGGSLTSFGLIARWLHWYQQQDSNGEYD